MIALVPLSGCSAVTGLDDRGNPGSSNTNGGDMAGNPDSPGSDVEDGGSEDDGEVPEPGEDALPDFAITDVNQDSPRHGDAVSPRDYVGQVSAWYFGHST